MSSDARSASKGEALNSFKLLDLFRKWEEGSDTQELIAILNSFPEPNLTGRNKSTPLHLAVRTARKEILPLVLSHRASDLNAQDLTGATPLHIATSLARVEIISVLLAQPEIDDMIRNDAGQTCLDVAASVEAAKMIQVSRHQFNATFIELYQGYLTGGNSEQLLQWLGKKRSRCIDFSVKVPSGPRGTTILHEAARRKDLPLLEACYKKGADLLVRDARGKPPMEMAKDDKIKAFFRQALNEEGRVLKQQSYSEMSSRPPSRANSIHNLSILGQAPALPVRKGYLHKWTNLAKGYKHRWFVLSNGTLSYYRHQQEEGKASRGIIAMNHAKIIEPGEDKLKFEIVSTIAKFRFYLKADHPLEAMRWVEDLRLHVEATATTSEPTALPTSLGNEDGSSTYPSRANSGSSAVPSMDHGPGPLLGKRKSAIQSMVPAAVRKAASRTNSYMGDKFSMDSSSPFNHDADVRSIAPSLAGSIEEKESSSILTGFGEDDTSRPPQEESFVLLANSARAQIETSEQLLDSLVMSPTPPLTSSSSLDVSQPSTNSTRPASVRSTTSVRQTEVKEALRDSLKKLNIMVDDYIDQVQQREKWYRARYEREIEARRMWEDNMQKVAAQQEELEQQLHKETEKGSRRKRELREARMTLLASPMQTIESDEGSPSLLSTTEEATKTPPLTRTFSPLARTISTPTRGAIPSSPDELSDDESDEFFEAIDSGALTLETSEPIAAPHTRKWPAEMDWTLDPDKILPYKPYETLRTRIPISVDDRPSVSLWGILKNSIGKDLTKISFPVSFNEPTSMLERMAEDMEFSECLDAAALHEDSTKRMAYVAAFAMSNYSSTIGRIAKPFNPMLGETFEYCSMTKHYRYISEQVSHHPPISACIAESPSFKFYAEVDAKSKFLGKSFEIRPTGISHCDLRLPAEWAPQYPKDASGKALEHYSWKKVTSSVSNFILGSPTIDHFGDMVLTNHRTGDRCVLTFKPKGWRGANSCEIKGQVTDANGQKVWDIAGRWSTQLVARRAGVGSGELLPDASIPQEKPEYLLLWKNSEKPEKTPFNLTPFAITLNDKSEGLAKWLPPTDCRLRPDLHAFEAGKFEEANELKTGLEELQRKTRKRRELGELPPHKPRWFVRDMEPDTGEGYWKPLADEENTIAYWEERNKIGRARLGGESDAMWEGVDEIFGDFALL